MSARARHRVFAWFALLAQAAAVRAAQPLSLEQIAGVLNGEPVYLREVEEVIGGAAERSWREIDQIVRDSGRALCVERALERLAGAEGIDVATWRARLWSGAAPSDAGLQAALAADSAPGDAVERRAAVAHALHVRGYRQAVDAAAGQALADNFTWAIQPAPARFTGEPVIAPVVARCFGAAVSGAEVESFAAFPLYRRRAEFVATVCRQFEIDYSNPLLLRRAAQARGVSVDELLKAAEDSAEVPEAEVHAAALQRYGNAAPTSLSKARLGLTAQRRVAGRLTLVEELRRSGSGECKLALPAAPVVKVRGSGAALGPPDALRVAYFGAFRCEHCEAGFAALLRLRERWGDRLRLEFRHHFPESAAAPFADALQATCAARQERSWDYARWRIAGDDAESDAARALGLDSAAFSRCLADPASAVSVLLDTEEGMRLGFREAVPSWVIGRRPRRGFQGDRILDETIRGEGVAPADGGAAAP